jgi:serine protease Do
MSSLNTTGLKTTVPAALFAFAMMLAGAVRADLPDFTQLAEKSTPAVVNVTARQPDAVVKGNGDADSDEQELPDIFKRFFGDPRNPQNPHHGGRGGISGGSGFIISADGYILTNHHVVEGADEVTVSLKDRREFRAKVVGSDPQSDVALLKVDAKDLPTVAIGSSDRLKPGQWVVAIGSPFGFQHSVTAGIVSAKGRSFSEDQRYVPYIQTDVPINRGNSGGPLFNMAGEVVGINSQIFSNTGGYMGLSFAIPIEVATKVADQLKTKGKVTRGSLGVLIQEVNREISDALALPRIGGALVGKVNGGSPAEKAGIKVQDVILAYNGTAIDHSGDLPPLVGMTAPGTRATLTVFRDGKTLELPVMVGELQEDRKQASAAPAAGGASANGLGIVVGELSDQDRETLELDKDGVAVEKVTGTEARRAGIQEGDVILMVGRKPIASVKDFESAARTAPAGKAVMLLVRRGDASSFIAITPPVAK